MPHLRDLQLVIFIGEATQFVQRNSRWQVVVLRAEQNVYHAIEPEALEPVGAVEAHRLCVVPLFLRSQRHLKTLG